MQKAFVEPNDLTHIAYLYRIRIAYKNSVLVFRSQSLLSECMKLAYSSHRAYRSNEIVVLSWIPYKWYYIDWSFDGSVI